MRNLLIYIMILSGGFFLYSCENEEVEPEDVNVGYGYQPVSIGDYWEYEIDQIDYLLTGDQDTSHYFVREVVEDSTQDFEETSYHMYRYYRNDTTSSWSLDSIWQMKKTPNRLIRTENNIRLIKLIFPVEEDKEWDGNALNGQSGYETYKITDLEGEFTFDNTAIGPSLKVEQGDNLQTLIDTDFRYEVFARDIGLVYKYKRVLFHQPGDDTTGVLFKQKLIDHVVQ